MVYQLLTAAEIVARSFTVTGISQPTGLTNVLLDTYSQGVTARILGRLGVTAAPSSEPTLTAAKEVAYILVGVKVRRNFFPMNSEASAALNIEEQSALKELDDLRVDQGSGGVDIEVWGGDT